LKIRRTPLPLIVTRATADASIVSVLSIIISSVVIVIVRSVLKTVASKSIASPLVAFAIASRRRQFTPGQFAAFAAPSAVDCTVMVAARATGMIPARLALPKKAASKMMMDNTVVI